VIARPPAIGDLPVSPGDDIAPARKRDAARGAQVRPPVLVSRGWKSPLARLDATQKE